jgi:hypothetical protein
VTALLFAIGLASSTPLVRGADDCVDVDALSRALDDVGGIDAAERVTLAVVARDDGGYELDIELLLIGVPRFTRTTALRPVECKDVPELVALLVATLRREHANAPSPSPPPIDAWRPAPERRRRLAADSTTAEVEGCFTSCLQPPELGPFSLSAAMGGDLWSGLRLQADVGIEVTPQLALLIVADASRLGSAAHFGAAWRTVVEELDLSARAALGGGVAPGLHRPSPYLSPVLSARARWGWLFVEAGTSWQLGVAPWPGAYAQAGIALVAPRGRPR